MLLLPMRHIRVIYPGKTKESFIKEGISKYLKLLKTHARIEIVELRPGIGSKEEVIKQESMALLKVARKPFCLLDREGKEFSSEEFAAMLKDISEIDFVVGGPFGVSEELKRTAHLRVSLSRLTFTHELSRLILMEQLYRAMTIIQGKVYHY